MALCMAEEGSAALCGEGKNLTVDAVLEDSSKHFCPSLQSVFFKIWMSMCVCTSPLSHAVPQGVCP